MKHTILASALLAGLGLGTSTLPSAAMPMTASGVTAPANADLIQVRMHRRHRMQQGSASRGNAAMPSRGARGQQYGNTTGGPRR
ncbi:hypothetical protein MKK63_08520 [Methylobacterium sp. J-088]|uniref:hypothetical protein n=1 Tax=Methylobacterium sp. J-088 TaxID=2836664 RepID=UPI001FB887F2|nr:hypothetical protein [Methylobacterium sp. J-088]MCJ2062750.1 hypothetical protein [Methylobacterium sp. J-088]